MSHNGFCDSFDDQRRRTAAGRPPHIVDARLGAARGAGRRRGRAGAGHRVAVASLASGVAAAATCWAYWYIADDGLAGEPAPRTLWMWIALTGAAAAVLTLGWRSARWWRRGASVAAVPLCLLSSALALNGWVGYFPTVQTAWNQLAAGPLPDQTDA